MLDPFRFRTTLTILLTAGFVGLATGCNSSDDSDGVSGFVTQAVAVGDLNGSGGLDILTANAVYQDGNDVPGFLTSRLQNPAASGSFLDPLRSDTGVYPLALAIGDLDEDGRPDVVVANYRASSSTDRSVDVHFQSTTAGTFLAPTRLSVGSRRPLDVVVADLTGAGHLDVVVAASGSNDVLVFFHGTTPGTFLAPVSFTVSGDPAAVAAADLTGSGTGPKDLIVAMANGKVAVLLHGPTAGTFLAPVDFTTGADPVAVKIGDIDGDGHLDILTANYSNGTGGLSILRQNPATPGTFLAAQTLDTGDYASAGLAVGDLDGDGHLDVVVANAGLPGYPGSVAVFRQDPAHAGVFLEPDFYRGYYGPLSVAIADLKGDGKPALVVADGDPAVRWPDPLNPGQFQPPVWLRQ